MIQRLQTVYLALAVILLTICSCLPIGTFVPETMGDVRLDLYNMCIMGGESGWDFTVCGLFVLLAAAVVTSVITIFGYNNRKRQIRNCMLIIFMLIVWELLYVFFGYVIGHDAMEFRYNYPAVLPLISIVFVWMARRHVIADEKLIRSVDRIR